MSNRLGLAALILLMIAGGLFFLFQQFPGAISGQGDQIRLVEGLLVLSLVGGSAAMGWSGGVGLALKQALFWAALFLFTLTLYAYRTELMGMAFRVAGVTLPAMPMSTPPDAGPATKTTHGTVYLRAIQGGHFLADAAVNGTHVRFLVDTGASMVVLSPQDAQRLRIDLKKLDFNIPMETANGKNFSARVTLDKISIGSISRNKVQAVVVRDGLEQSLLGMSFLNSIGSFEMGNGVLILRD